MINKIVLTLASLAFASVAAAGEDGFKISGDLATSIFTESGKGANQLFGSSAGAIDAGSLAAASGVTGATAHENNGDFSVDLVEINLEKSMGNSGVVMGIGYGRMFDLINGSVDSNGNVKSTLNLTNAYFHHKLGDTGLSFKVGKFASGVGYETYNYMNNLNYTRAYSFNYMNPWFLTGLAADYTFNDMISGGIVVANTTKNLDADENESKFMGVNATIKPMEGLTVKLNYLSGREGVNDNVDYVDTTRLNATVMYTLNSMYDFAIHYSSYSKEDAASTKVLTDKTVTSTALYAGAKMETWGAGLRYEMFDDGDGMLTVVDNAHNIITLTGWYNIDQNAVLKAEFATTSADKKVLADDTQALGTDDSMTSYGLGFMYRF